MDAMELDVEGMTRQMSQATVGNRVVAPTNKGAKGKGAKTAQRTCLSGQAADGGEAGHSFGASAEGMIGSKVEIVSQARGWIGGEIAAFDASTGECKVLVDDDCLGSTQVDAFIPSLAIHLCSGDNLSIAELIRTVHQHIEGQGVFVRLANMSDSTKLFKLNQELELELAMLDGEDETPSIDDKQAFSTILDEEPSALIVVIGTRDEHGRDNVFGYCYSYKEQAPGSKVARGKPKKTVRCTESRSSLCIAEMFVDKSRRACGFGEMLLIETLRHYSGFCTMPSTSECFMHAKIDGPDSCCSHLDLSTNNTKAISFFERFGFVDADANQRDKAESICLTLDLGAGIAQGKASGCAVIPQCLASAAQRITQRQSSTGKRSSRVKKEPATGGKKPQAAKPDAEVSASQPGSSASSPESPQDKAPKATSKRVTAPTAKSATKKTVAKEASRAQEVEPRGAEEEVEEEEEEEEEDSSSDDDDEICGGCGNVDDPVTKKSFFIVCDKCDGAFHLSCAGLKVVPSDDWFCPGCTTDVKPPASKTVAKKNSSSKTVTSSSSSKGETPGQSAKQDASQDVTGGDSSDSDDPCAKCGSYRDPHLMLICEGCEKCYHTLCVGLKRVPRGDFFCEECDEDKTTERLSLFLPNPSAGMPGAEGAEELPDDMMIMPSRDGLDVNAIKKFYDFRKQAAIRHGGIYGSLLYEGCILIDDADVCRDDFMIPSGLMAIKQGERVVIDCGAGLLHGTVRREPVVLESRDQPGGPAKLKLLQYEMSRTTFSITGPKTASEVLKELSVRVHYDVARNHVMSDLLARAVRFDRADDSALVDAPPSPVNTAEAAESIWWHGLEALVTENQSKCFVLPGTKFPNRLPLSGEVRLLDICHFATNDMTIHQASGAAQQAMISGFYEFDTLMQTSPGRYKALWKPVTSGT